MEQRKVLSIHCNFYPENSILKVLLQGGHSCIWNE
jgi:hypothetical protein